MDSTELLYQKGLEFIQKRKLMHVQSQEEQRQKEINEFVGRPRLCEKSRELIEDIRYTTFEDHLQTWLETKQRKIEESKSQIEMNRKTPTRRIKTPKGYTSPIDGWTERVQAYYAMKNQEPEEHAFMPEINSMSRALFPMWNERIEDRLMRLEEERLKRQQELAARYSKEEFSYRPTTNPYDKERPKDVNDYLYKEGVIIGERKKLAAERCFEQMYSFKPYISEYTRELAKQKKAKESNSVIITENQSKPEESRKLNKYELHNFIERNYSLQLNSIKKRAAAKPADLDLAEGYSNLRSKSQTRVNPAETADRLIRSKQLKEKKIEESLKNKEKKVLEECTFTPSIKRSYSPSPYSSFTLPFAKSENKSTLLFEDSAGKKIELKATIMCPGIVMKNVEDIEKIVNSLLKM